MHYLRSASVVIAVLLATLGDAVPVTDSPDAGSTTADVFPPPSSESFPASRSVNSPWASFEDM